MSVRKTTFWLAAVACSCCAGIAGAALMPPQTNLKLQLAADLGGVATIGNREDQAVTYAPWNGDIAEILVYDTALSNVDRIAVQDYLNFKWFDVESLPEPSTALSLFVIGGAAVTARRHHAGARHA
jgi:hypothetical protein